MTSWTKRWRRGALTAGLMVGLLAGLSACATDDNPGSTSGTGGTTGGTDLTDVVGGDDASGTDGTDAGQGDAATADTTTPDTSTEDTTSESPDPESEFLGTFQTAGNAGASEVFTFEVPEGATSLGITAIGDTGVYTTVNSLTAPDGKILIVPNWFQDPFNQGSFQMCLSCTLRVTGAQGAGAVLVPNAPDVPFQAGTWKMSVASFEAEIPSGFGAPTINPVSSEVDVTVTWEMGGTAAGVLDLNLFLTGADGLTGETAPNDAALAQAIQTMRTIYAAQNVSIGEVRYFDISDSGLDKITTMNGPNNDFEALAALTADAPHGVNLVFVESITDPSVPGGGFAVILGVSGGIPGPIGVQGAGRSMVAVTTLSSPANPEITFGHTMAHEVGHYLGLFHSSEQFNISHDPLPDTPEGQSNNLMFNNPQGGDLSDEQGQVMRNNPWVRPAQP